MLAQNDCFWTPVPMTYAWSSWLKNISAWHKGMHTDGRQNPTGWEGLEPTTLGLRVSCSTAWYILRISWKNAAENLQRKSGWIGHTLRKPMNSTPCEAWLGTRKGKRKRGLPCNSWREYTEVPLKQQGYTWTIAAATAQRQMDRQYVIDSLCSSMSIRPEKCKKDTV